MFFLFLDKNIVSFFLIFCTKNAHLQFKYLTTYLTYVTVESLSTNFLLHFLKFLILDFILRICFTGGIQVDSFRFEEDQNAGILLFMAIHINKSIFNVEIFRFDSEKISTLRRITDLSYPTGQYIIFEPVFFTWFWAKLALHLFTNKIVYLRIRFSRKTTFEHLSSRTFRWSSKLHDQGFSDF